MITRFARAAVMAAAAALLATAGALPASAEDVTVPQIADTDALHCVSDVTGHVAATDITDAQATASRLRKCAVDVVTTKTAGSPTSKVGDTVVWTVTVVNEGLVAVPQIVVTEVPPALSAVSNPGAFDPTRWFVTALAPGQTMTTTVSTLVGQAGVNQNCVVTTAFAPRLVTPKDLPTPGDLGSLTNKVQLGGTPPPVCATTTTTSGATLAGATGGSPAVTLPNTGGSGGGGSDVALPSTGRQA